MVSARIDDLPVGMTVAAFASVSLSPPLIVVSLERQAVTLTAVVDNGCFAVNVLSDEQRALSDRFALPGTELTRFEGVRLLESEAAESPLIADALVHLDCRLEATHGAGDHVLCIGRVNLALHHSGQPLLFHASSYHRLARL